MMIRILCIMQVSTVWVRTQTRMLDFGSGPAGPSADGGNLAPLRNPILLILKILHDLNIL